MVVLSTLRRTLVKYPLISNVLTMTTLLAGADLTCQLIEKKELTRFDFKRLRNMATLGLVYYGPVLFYYYRILDRRLPAKNPRTILLKLFIDQFVFTIPSLAIFFLSMGYMEGKQWEDNVSELRMKFLPTYVTSCLFWPGVQIVNFAVVPAVYRVAYISGMSFVWISFLSYVKNRHKLPTILQRIEDFTTRKQIV